MNPKLLILFSVLLILSVARRDDPKYWKKVSDDSENTIVYDQKEYFFTQIVDHYNYQATQTWQQRYFAITDFFNNNVGPVFIYVCGEYVCPGVPESRQWVVTLATQFQGLILVPEHRYYGKSMPFGDDSHKIQNLVHLSS